MSDDKWKKQTYAAGVAMGILVGLGTAYLLIRTAEENDSGGPPELSTGDIIKSVLGIVGVMRGIASLGDG
jgi:hypothetical protein